MGKIVGKNLAVLRPGIATDRRREEGKKTAGNESKTARKTRKRAPTYG